jgi:imidazolonepropionase
MNATHGDTDQRWDLLISGVHLATLQGACGYGELRDAAIALRGDRIAWLGSAQQGRAAAAARGARVREFAGAWVTPGLIDCHTHLVYGGNRSLEFEMRLNGATYEQIARAGGGIQSTVQATQAATDDDLLRSALTRARRLCAEGVTTLEIKSGYGLELEQELRLLRTARSIGAQLPVSVRGTFLGLHALPPAFKDRREEFVAAVSGPWLDAVVAEGLADAVDAFCENIAFTLAETECLLRRARAANLGVHLHAGQLTDMGAAQLAARWQAWSVDHLEYVDETGIAALAAAGTVAVMLPGAFYMLRQDQPPPVAALRRAGVPLAVATDCNPGTSPCTSLLLAMNMACTLFGLTPEEVLAGVTRHAARALGLTDRGRLLPGLRADLAIWDIERPAELCYGLGANPCIGVVQGGNLHAS